MRWEPVAGCSPGSVSNIGSPLTPSECIVAGAFAGGTLVTLELGISDWGDAIGAPTLGTYQFTIDGAAGYISGGNGVFDGANPNDYGTADDLGPWDFVSDGNGCFVDMGHIDFVFANLPGGCSAMPSVSITQVNYEGGATIMGGCSITDPYGTDGNPSPTMMYGVTIIVEVPPGAKGTYNIPFNTSTTKSFLNDPFGAKITPLTLTSVDIIIPTGACCAPLGPGVYCTDDLTETECEAQALGGAYFFYPPGHPDGSTCAQVEPCPVCLTDLDCTDSNACTTDTCIEYVCYYALTYDDATHCCNGANGDTDPLDDDDQCTLDFCNPDNCIPTGNGAPVAETCYPALHDAALMDGEPCDHAVGCVTDDYCEDGVCLGYLPWDRVSLDPLADMQYKIPCEDITPCSPHDGWYCEADGFCDCSDKHDLCVEFLHVRDHGRHYTDPCCFDEGDLVEAVVYMGPGTSLVTGGQFLIEYDADCLEFVNAWGIDPYLTTIDEDAEPGLIWIAVLAMNPLDPEDVYDGEAGPLDIVGMDFLMKGDLACCEPSEICLISVNPRNTKLVDDEGEEAPSAICECEPCPRLNGDITLVTPAPGFQVNADCGIPTAIIEWDTPTASDTCDGELQVLCQIEHDDVDPELPVGHLWENGGEFPQGITYIICSATNSCGDKKSAVWTVNVSDQHAIDVEVHLSPTMNPGYFERCICFDLYGMDCDSDPVHMCEVMGFGPPYNFPAHARALLKVDKGNYLCIAAYDPLHTICAETMIECVDNMWVAVFKGDPLAGGNWLIGGNLNNDEHIDVLDAGTYMYEIASGASYMNGNTTCDTEAPHGDINADGAVDAADYTFIVENFLMACKSPCCDDPAAGADAVLDVSIKELRAMGQGHLSVADLNGDGRLNTDDMTAYMQGVEPVMLDKKRSSSR